MSNEMRSLLALTIIVGLWTLFPLIPAWLTYRITPSQKLGLKGPLQGMTLNTSGSFAAYLVVALLLGAFVWPTGKLLVGKVLGDATWVITGKAALLDADGNPASQRPDLSHAYLRVLPEQNVIDTDLSIKVPFPSHGMPTIYIDVPNWGGAKISLSDRDAFEEDPLNREIHLKNMVEIRQFPKTRLAVGEPQP
jgi:hypothetical protein